MRKVIAYTLVPLDKVSEHLAQGWQPWGPPMYLGMNAENWTVAKQAMVKYASNGEMV